MAANEQYQELRKKIDYQLVELKNHLELIDRNQQLDSKNYGYVGNLNYVYEQLENTILFLRGDE